MITHLNEINSVLELWSEVELKQEIKNLLEQESDLEVLN